MEIEAYDLNPVTGGGGGQGSAGGYLPYTLGFQVCLAALLVVEAVLGFSSNLMVLLLYISQPHLVSVSNMLTASLHALDVAVCMLCLPVTLVIVLLPPGPSFNTLCCFHEACVTFASIATAINVLVISMDRYDISVRPVDRLLTTRRALLLLAAIWLTSIAVFFIPFLEVDFFSMGGEEESELVVPIFFTTVAVMLFTYSRILKALNIKTDPRGPSCRGRRKKQKKRGVVEGGEAGERCTTDGSKQLSPPLILSPFPTPTATSPPALSSSVTLVNSRWGAAATPGLEPSPGTAPTPGPAPTPGLAPTPGPAPAPGPAPTPGPAPVGVQASVSAILALRRAVRRHRDRRERQRRVFRMSLLIISTYLGCWAPLALINMLVLAMGPSDALVSLRLWFLALAYGTTVSHPLLYAFTRQTLRRTLRAKVKKRVSLLQVDPSPGGAVVHNSWVENHKSGRPVRLEASEAANRCLAEAV
ncbi:unnamed protein product [Merluccius merluccius]